MRIGTFQLGRHALTFRTSFLRGVVGIFDHFGLIIVFTLGVSFCGRAESGGKNITLIYGSAICEDFSDGDRCLKRL
jgi:hypothetical protein